MIYRDAICCFSSVSKGVPGKTPGMNKASPAERHETMRSLDELFRKNNLKDPEDIDALLELADMVSLLIHGERYPDIERLVSYTVSNDFYEAFSWIMALLQEEFEKEENSGLNDFTCFIGKSIANYNEFIERLNVDFNVTNNDVETTLDNNGEVQSFFNIFTYNTIYKNIFLITAENFDTKDNDFIQYKLLFTGNPEKSCSN